MQLASVEVIPYTLPFREPYVTARGTLRGREMVLLRIRDAEGVVGLGEAVPLSLRGGTALETVVRELSGLDRLKAIDDIDSVIWASGSEDLANCSAPSRAAWQSAMSDLAARQRGIPVWEMQGATDCRFVPCNATLTAGTPREVARQAESWAQDGFGTFKLKVGPEHGIEQAAVVRDALGPTARIRVDANGSWSVDEAITELRSAEPIGLELAEEPVHGLEQLAGVRSGTGLKIVADESFRSHRDLDRALALGSCDMVGVKLSKVGDPRGVTDERLPMILSSALDGPVGIAAAAHAFQVLASRGQIAPVAHGLATQRLFAETIASVECELRGPMLHVPDGPGLGVVIDEQALERHRLRPGK